MHKYSDETMELATEIVDHLQGGGDEDVNAVADWLINGGDDGSPATELWVAFDQENTLPSKS